MNMPVRCIIDTDPGVDDVIAILLALASPELLVVSINLTHGNTPLAATLTNLEKLFYALHRQLDAFPEQASRWPGVDMELRRKYGVGKIIVMLGDEGPIQGTPVTAKYFHGLDGLSNITTRHPDLTPPTDYASPFITFSPVPVSIALPLLVDQHPPSSLAYLALGPLTSLATIHLTSVASEIASTSLLHKFAIILAMGGAVDWPGNTTPCAEFNVYADPYAAQLVFALSLPNFYLLPLDITTPHTLPFPLYQSRVDPSFVDTQTPSFPTEKTPLTHFTSSFLEGTREVMAQFSKDDWMEQHDPVIIWAAIEWAKGSSTKLSSALPPGWEWQWRDFEVETEGKLTRGMLVVDRRGSASVTPVPATISAVASSLFSKNRSIAVEQREAAVGQVEPQSISGAEEDFIPSPQQRIAPGVKCVVASPGCETLRSVLLERIWGVSVA